MNSRPYKSRKLGMIHAFPYCQSSRVNSPKRETTISIPSNMVGRRKTLASNGLVFAHSKRLGPVLQTIRYAANDAVAARVDATRRERRRRRCSARRNILVPAPTRNSAIPSAATTGRDIPKLSERAVERALIRD